MTRLIVASNNPHKVAELREMIAEDGRLGGLQVLGLRDLASPVPDIEESADSFLGNALLKADGYAAWAAGLGGCDDDWIIADDSGLCVDVLEGGPGVWSARFAGPGASDEANNHKLVAELEARGLSSSAASYVCVLALRRVDGLPPREVHGHHRVGACVWVEGRCAGEVRTLARGSGGFGYDPWFWIDDGRTFAELTRAEKASRSHRGAAMRQSMDVLAAQLD